MSTCIHYLRVEMTLFIKHISETIEKNIAKVAYTKNFKCQYRKKYHTK